MKKEQIDIMAVFIGYIDSGEKQCFLETVGTEHQITSKIFYENNLIGVFYSCFAYETLRLSISFDTDIVTEKFNDEIASLVNLSMEKSGKTSCMIYIRNENKGIISFLKNKFQIPPGSGEHYYASIEFIMRRKVFTKKISESPMEIRQYEEKNIDKYLSMLDNSMTFTNPPTNFMEKKMYYSQYFRERMNNNSFEAFWINNELIGLYWRKNAEIDFFAIDVNYQRKGYGTIMLTRAIEMIFENTSEDFVYLYAVDWNEKGQIFYRKYGMEENGHSYMLKYKK
jgi:ribosomal protein S18 acetylase RimI-like enzyme